VQRQPVAPVPPLHHDVSAPLFVGVYRFFNGEVQPWLFSDSREHDETIRA
jgi:hypothetical protein